MLQRVIPRVLFRFISARLFSDSQVKKKLKGLHFADVAEIQGAVIDELKKVQKEEFSTTFQKLHDRAKACIHVYLYIYIYIYMPMELSLNKKKRYVSTSCVFDF